MPAPVVPLGGVKNWPCWPKASDPLTPARPPVGVNSFTHHAVLSRRVIPNNEHHGAAANTEKALSGVDMGVGRTKRGGWRARGHSPQCLGVGHRSGPVNVQVSAATGGGRGGIPRLGGGGGPQA